MGREIGGEGRGKKGREGEGMWRNPESGLPRGPRWLSAGLSIAVGICHSYSLCRPMGTVYSCVGRGHWRYCCGSMSSLIKMSNKLKCL